MENRVKSVSMYGSYMYFNHRKIKKRVGKEIIEEEALCLKSDHGRSVGRDHVVNTKNVLQFVPIIHHKKADYDFQTDFHLVSMICDKSRVDITFADDETVVVRGKGDELSLMIDNMPLDNTNRDRIIKLRKPTGEVYYVINSYKSQTIYIAYATKGTIELEQNYLSEIFHLEGNTVLSRLYIKPVESEFQMVIREVNHNLRDVNLIEYDFDKCVDEMMNSFEQFFHQFPTPQNDWYDIYKTAVYYIWSCVNKKREYYSKDVISMGTEIAGNWNSNISYAAQSLYKAHPRLMIDQIEAFFDFQDDLGGIPGPINDDGARWNFIKPASQGYFLKKVLDHYQISREEKQYIYDHISAFVNFWLKYKDSNQDGICEYFQGYETGLDNATVFDNDQAVDSPDCTAYLIKTMEFLSEIAYEIEKEDEAQKWAYLADELTKKALNYFIQDGKLVARLSWDGKIVESRSFILYFFLILGERIPLELRKELIQNLQDDLVTPFGIASEPIDSPQYCGSAMRGPIWYHTSVIIDGVDACGYHDLAKQLAYNYCHTIRENGLGVAFDAKTGKSTSANVTQQINNGATGSFLYLYQKYILSK